MAGSATARLAFACSLVRDDVIPDHHPSFRILDELLNRCVAHLGPLGHGGRLRHYRLAD